MSQSGASRLADPWRTRRRYCRVPTATPVEIYTKRTVGPPLLGQIENLSVGGALASCSEAFEVNTDVAMLFQLPPNTRIRAFGRVIYAVPRRKFGVAFVDLDQDARRQVEEFTRKQLGHARRSSRVPYRVRVIVRCGNDGSSETADTVLVSRNGGLLVCHGTYQEGQEIHLWSPEKNRSAKARVVFQHAWVAGGLVELGFEFIEPENFWPIDFIKEDD